MPTNDAAHPVLIAAPLWQDASAIADALKSAGIHVSICNSLDEGARQISPATAAVVLTEEALEHEQLPALHQALKSQPAWSELPIVVLARGGEARWNELLELTSSAPGSLMVLERPMQAATLLQTVRVALRARRRQHQLRDLLEDQQRNIRERQHHAAELEQALDQRTREVTLAQQGLATSQRMAAVGTLAAGLAHDMNNLLLPLEARLSMLLTNARIEDEVRAELTVIVALLDHLKDLSRNLSLFSRDPDREGIVGRTNIGHWCSSIHKLLDASVGREIVMKWDCPANLPEVAIAPHRLTQAVQNLIHNARDAVVAGKAKDPRLMPRITIEARPETPQRNIREVSSGSVVIKIIDNGMGMDEETQRRCIEPFFTTRHRPDVPGGGGSGLGLSLAHQIADRAGGTLEIESALGKGTTITLKLPVASSGAGERSS